MSQKKETFWKYGFVILNILTVIILGISLCGGLLLYQSGGRSMSVFVDDTSYLQSQGLKENLQEEAYVISSYAGYRDSFETDGEYDENKNIDVMAYLDNSERINIANEPLNYRLGDLLVWAEDSKYQTESEAMRNMNEGDTTVSEDVLDDNGNVVGTKITTLYNANSENSTEKLTELYAPQDYSSIEDYAQKYNVNLQRCYQALDQAIGIVQDEVDNYKGYADRYNAKNTNLRYIVENRKTGSVYSNGSVTNLHKDSLIIDKVIHDYSVKVALDAGFAVDDSYAKASNFFDKYAKYSKLMILGIIVGLLGFVITLSGITVMAGRKGEKHRRLYGIDRIPTEIAAAFWVGIGILILSTMSGFADEYLGRFLLYVIVFEGCMLLLLNVVFLMAYTSLVRRIKAGTIGENSICGRLVRGLKMIFRHMNIVWKTLVLFGVYMIGNFILCYMSVILLIVYNAAVLVFLCKQAVQRQKLLDGVTRIVQGDMESKLDETQFSNTYKELAVSINNISNGLQKAVDSSIKNERTKSDLITNVSHDIKTPLTSIINYVGLLKLENIQDEKVKGYIEVLDQKSQRLKHLTEDLVEASKISSGNIEMNIVNLDFHELLQQTVGEFEEKFQERNLELVVSQPEEPVVIQADGKHMWRIIDNLFGNVYKYAMPGTRVYVDLFQDKNNTTFSIRNISESSLNISAEELMERFIQGDISRSTEGSGLGLSIAKNLTTLQNGTFDIYLDGDLFKVTMTF